ncbi:hypothetical protein ACT3SP_15940 [Brachybacterium sp. AOP43-C2-M15]|uniref:hypothetical protein n=1 Tax=Brachybacterium sp. AOP43-C2-M15 TaxID=3457661 RepID=UPI004033D38B
MEHRAVVEVIRNVIENREGSEMSRSIEDYDLEAIAVEIDQRTGAADAEGLDPQQYWQIIEMHARS